MTRPPLAVLNPRLPDLEPTLLEGVLASIHTHESTVDDEIELAEGVYLWGTLWILGAAIPAF